MANYLDILRQGNDLTAPPLGYTAAPAANALMGGVTSQAPVSNGSWSGLGNANGVISPGSFGNAALRLGALVPGVGGIATGLIGAGIKANNIYSEDRNLAANGLPQLSIGQTIGAMLGMNGYASGQTGERRAYSQQIANETTDPTIGSYQMAQLTKQPFRDAPALLGPDATQSYGGNSGGAGRSGSYGGLGNPGGGGQGVTGGEQGYAKGGVVTENRLSHASDLESMLTSKGVDFRRENSQSIGSPSVYFHVGDKKIRVSDHPYMGADVDLRYGGDMHEAEARVSRALGLPMSPQAAAISAKIDAQQRAFQISLKRGQQEAEVSRMPKGAQKRQAMAALQAAWATEDAGNAGVGTPAPGGGYAVGGGVTQNRLTGPNPPGPDTGYGALESGEFVVKRDMAKRYAPVLRAINAGTFRP